MLIEQVFPEVIGDLRSLRDCLYSECHAAGMNDEQFEQFLSALPEKLRVANCFYDKMTNLWRYEFGQPSDLAATNQKFWGTHIWQDINVLFQSTGYAKKSLSPTKLEEYMQRLGDISKHQDALVEMYPVLRRNDASMCFEISGEGIGNKTMDWKIGPIGNRFIRLDVKNRMADLYNTMDRPNVSQPPQHDPELLFRSVEGKFLEANPNEFLQGVWIVTQIKQDKTKLQHAFDNLNPQKVHFAVLGDHRDDAFVMARRAEDLQFINEQLVLSASERFTF